MGSWLFLGIILIIAWTAKNQSLLIATGIVLLIKLLPQSSKILDLIGSKGINWGVTVISVAILVPIAKGDIGFQDLLDSVKTPLGWIALFCGGLVAILSSKGVHLIADSPEVIVTLVLGTIIGVVFFKGIAAGPIIASGITYYVMTAIQFFWTK